jgi:hypothetical protein
MQFTKLYRCPNSPYLIKYGRYLFTFTSWNLGAGCASQDCSSRSGARYGQPIRACPAHVQVGVSDRRTCVPRWPSSLGACLGFMAGTFPIDAPSPVNLALHILSHQVWGVATNDPYPHDKSEPPTAREERATSRRCTWRISLPWMAVLLTRAADETLPVSRVG